MSCVGRVSMPLGAKRGVPRALPAMILMGQISLSGVLALAFLRAFFSRCCLRCFLFTPILMPVLMRSRCTEFGPYLMAETVIDGNAIDLQAYYNDSSLAADGRLQEALRELLAGFEQDGETPVLEK